MTLYFSWEALLLVSNAISTIVNCRPSLQSSRLLPSGAVAVLEELGELDGDNLQYQSHVGEKYGYKDERPFYLSDASGLAPGKFLLISCGFGKAFTNDQV